MGSSRRGISPRRVRVIELSPVWRDNGLDRPESEIAMDTRVEIQCINRSDRLDPHQRIISVGGMASERTHWKLSHRRAIELVESRRNSFYVTRDGKALDVVVAVSEYGHRYLKTAGDPEQPDNLLSLPECP